MFGNMRRGLPVSVILLVVYVLVQNAECENNRTLEHVLVDGIDVEKLSDAEVYDLLNAEDVKFTGELDIWIGKQTLKDRHRVKRVAPIVARVAWAAGRALFRSLAKSTPRITRSGGKLTKQFFKKGGFETAKRDFHRFKPANVKQFTGKNGQQGYTGKILDGKYQLTARKTSTHGKVTNNGNVVQNGRPTLEIRSNTGGKVVRKVRYDQ